MLRSSSTVAIEDHKRSQGSLFDAPAVYISSPVVLLVYKFHELGLDLSVAGTRLKNGKGRLEPSGPLNFIAMWPYTFGGPTRTFDQSLHDDPFGDVGGLENPSDSELG